MDSAQRQTIIIDIKSARINLPIFGGTLSLETLRQYCPQAKGLIYSKHGQTHGLAVTNGKFIIDKDVTEYEVHLEPVISNPKERRVEEILSALRNGSSSMMKETSSDATSITKNSKHRLLHIGWLHKSSKGKFNQMKKPVGGIKELKLNPNLQYNVQQIISLAKNEFMKDGIETSMLLKSCEIKLGFFDRTPIDRFIIDDIECDLWTYARKLNLSCKIKFYLLTSLQNNQVENDSLCMLVEEQSMSTSIKLRHRKRKRLALSQVQENSLTISKNSSSTSKISSILSETDRLALPSIQDKTLVHRSLHMSSTLNDQNENFNKVQIYYRVIKYSKYTGEPLTCELDRDDVFDDAFPEVANLVKSLYDPSDDGYEIIRITINNEVLLEISIDDELKKKFIFPLKDLHTRPHSILYNMDRINGISCGSYGIGIIPFCSDSCNPMFTWYKNDKVFKEGQFLYWIFIGEQPNEENTWQCVITCSAEPSQADISKSVHKSNHNSLHSEENYSINPILPAADQICDIYSHSNLSLQFLKREEFKISKELLGAGAQGKVFKGSWLGTPIAIKSMNISNIDMKLVLREIEISNTIRHPNIIQVMGISIQPKTLYILMELVNGSTLFDIIFDDDSKEEYSLTVEAKNYICSQLCQAVNYLHQQKNPIIHRDLKPDNILVVRHSNVVKVSDLGLCKFNAMSTLMRSTLGNIAGNLKGTPLFMAPELILQTSEATVYSDIWAVACTIVELYNESVVWNISGDNPGVILKNLILQKEIPDLKNIPNEIKSTIRRCFSYNIYERPPLSDLIEQFASII